MSNDASLLDIQLDKKVYNLYDMETEKFFVNRDIKFHETTFFFPSTSTLSKFDFVVLNFISDTIETQSIALLLAHNTHSHRLEQIETTNTHELIFLTHMQTSLVIPSSTTHPSTSIQEAETTP